MIRTILLFPFMQSFSLLSLQSYLLSEASFICLLSLIWMLLSISKLLVITILFMERSVLLPIIQQVNKKSVNQLLQEVLLARISSCSKGTYVCASGNQT